MTIRALSQTPFAYQLLNGPVTPGISLGHGHLLFAGSVLSLTRQGQPRMSNGLECSITEPEPQAPVRIGGGRLEGDFGTILPGPTWDPGPYPRFAVSTDPGLAAWPILEMAGAGPGLTPLADDVAAGYLAARALFGAPHPETADLAEQLAAHTTSLSATLLRLAACGQLPEAAHPLLENGDPIPLLNWGATSGSGLLAGLGLYAPMSATQSVRSLAFTLPLDPPRYVHVDLYELTKNVPDQAESQAYTSPISG